VTKNFVDPSAPNDVNDENGHGTVVALVINDLAPKAQINVLKVADSSGRASEFDTLAALATCGNTDVVNLSLQFGLQDRVCKVCGRESQSSRSAVFENIVGQFDKRTRRSILIAAAGNYSLDELAFPARFSSLIAIGAINSQGNLSYESNWGKQYNDPAKPDNHFVCPGGDDTCDPVETVGSFGVKDTSQWHGTSFAAAYASGVAANVLAQQGSYDYEQTLDKLRKGADSKRLVGYDVVKHGHGVMQFV
jgi:subtilisin family serine protease